MISFIGPLSDAELALRSFKVADREMLVEQRDTESGRFLGEGSPEPTPAACIVVGRDLVGWIDCDDDRDWLCDDEVNVGYCVFRAHRSKGYATRALVQLCDFLESQTPAIRPTLLIDPANVASLAVARRAKFRHVHDVGDQHLFKPFR